MRRLVQLVPRRPPPEEAVAQVARRLSEEFSGEGIASETLYASDGLEAALGRIAMPEVDAVLLHYVGYGYARRGAPLRLARALSRWRREQGGRRLLVHFHEVAAFGPVWRSSFWMRPLQLHLAGVLARAASGVVTGLDRYAELLRRRNPRLVPRVLPIFSAIGEPAALEPFERREPSMVLFGGPEARRSVRESLMAELGLAVRALGIDRVVEIGRSPVAPERVAGASVTTTGELEGSRVSEELSRARAGYLAYHPAYLAKSTSYAAFAAHRALAVCGWPIGGKEPAPGEGRRWCRAGALEGLSTARQAEIVDEAAAWYAGHTAAQHARTWRELLE